MTSKSKKNNIRPSGNFEGNTDPALNSQNIPERRQPPSPSQVKTAEKKSIAERWKTSRFWLVRGTYYVFYSVWMVAMFIGGFIAWLISLFFL